MSESWSVPVLSVSVAASGTCGARPSHTVIHTQLSLAPWPGRRLQKASFDFQLCARTAALMFSSASLPAPCQNIRYDDVINALVLHLPRLLLIEAKLLIPNLTPRWLCHVTRVLVDSTTSLCRVFLPSCWREQKSGFEAGGKDCQGWDEVSVCQDQ